MSKISVIATCVIAALSTAGCAARPGPRITTERPAIIVRGGSVIFEMTGRTWKPAGGNWKPDHNEAPALHAYVVTVEDGGQICGPYSGRDVWIYRGNSQTPEFTFDRDGGFLGLGKKEPRLKSRLALTFDQQEPNRLIAPQQEFPGLRVVLSSGTCEVTNSRQVIRIRPQA